MACLPETEKGESEQQETAGYEASQRDADLEAEGPAAAGSDICVTDGSRQEAYDTNGSESDELRADGDGPEIYGAGGNEPDTDRTRGSSFGTGFLAGVLAVLFCMGIFLCGWSTAQHISGSRDAEAENKGAEILTDYHTLSKLDEVQNLIEEHFLREIDSEELASYLFKGVAAGLKDVYASYYSEEELQSVLDSSRGEYYGIGTTLEEDVETQEIRVNEVYANSPADMAGLQPGDVLLAVDDVVVSDQGLTEIVTLIKSKEDAFTLRVFRPESGEELELELECGDVELSFVEFEMKDGHTGFLRLTEFTEKAVEQFKEALKELDRQGMEKLLIDLRDNPGGRLDSVCEMLDAILPEGLIVYMEDRDGNREEKRSDGKQMVNCEIAVLVNGGSASASEIFAGAVQDYGLGPVIGTQTYGKGVVQDTYILSDGSAFKMTTEKYFTPKGQDIDGNGITPDIVIEEPEDDEEPGDLSAGGEPEAEGESETSSVGGRPENETGSEGITAGEESVDEAYDPVLEKALEALRGNGGMA